MKSQWLYDEDPDGVGEAIVADAKREVLTKLLPIGLGLGLVLGGVCVFLLLRLF